MDFINFKVEDFVCNESFQQYCLGVNADNNIFWEDWQRRHPSYQEIVNKAKQLFGTLNAHQGNLIEQLKTLKDGLDRQSWFKEQLLNNETPTGIQTIKRRSLRRLYQYVSAAVVLMLVGVSAYFILLSKSVHQLNNYDYYTTHSSHKTVMLPDSSIIVLNENSHLNISKNFDSHHREVTIIGEAYFNIKHDARHPFIVHTSKYDIRVLGTIFNVRAYSGDKNMETDLIKGRIEITTNDNTDWKVILKPSQKFILENKTIAKAAVTDNMHNLLKTGNIENTHVDIKTGQISETSWARKEIDINDEPLDSIASKLEAWYGVKISFSNEEVKHYRYTAMFDNETISDVLHFLQVSYPFKYIIKENSIVIDKE